MSDTLWCGIVPSISKREGVDVTATVMRIDGDIEIAYVFDDIEQGDVNDLVWDCEVAACIAEQLLLVQVARRATEALMEANERLHDAIDDEEFNRVSEAVKQASQSYKRAMTALPHSLL